MLAFEENIYTYIVIHRQKISLYQNSLLWLVMQNTLSWDQNPHHFTLDLVFYS